MGNGSWIVSMKILLSNKKDCNEPEEECPFPDHTSFNSKFFNWTGNVADHMYVVLYAKFLLFPITKHEGIPNSNFFFIMSDCKSISLVTVPLNLYAAKSRSQPTTG